MKQLEPSVDAHPSAPFLAVTPFTEKGALEATARVDAVYHEKITGEVSKQDAEPQVQQTGVDHSGDLDQVSMTDITSKQQPDEQQAAPEEQEQAAEPVGHEGTGADDSQNPQQSPLEVPPENNGQENSMLRKTLESEQNKLKEQMEINSELIATAEKMSREAKLMLESVKSVYAIIDRYEKDASVARDVATESLALFHPTPDEAALRIEFITSVLPSITFAAFLPDGPQGPIKAASADFLAKAFDWENSGILERLHSVEGSDGISMNLLSIHRARQAILVGDLEKAVMELENGSSGRVRAAVDGWLLRAKGVAEDRQLRELAKGAIYTKLASI